VSLLALVLALFVRRLTRTLTGSVTFRFFQQQPFGVPQTGPVQHLLLWLSSTMVDAMSCHCGASISQRCEDNTRKMCICHLTFCFVLLCTKSCLHSNKTHRVPKELLMMPEDPLKKENLKFVPKVSKCALNSTAMPESFETPPDWNSQAAPWLKLPPKSG